MRDAVCLVEFGDSSLSSLSPTDDLLSLDSLKQRSVQLNRRLWREMSFAPVAIKVVRVTTLVNSYHPRTPVSLMNERKFCRFTIVIVTSTPGDQQVSSMNNAEIMISDLNDHALTMRSSGNQSIVKQKIHLRRGTFSFHRGLRSLFTSSSYRKGT
nr:hypothetical protein CFP56_69171 [Quercus suber]